MSEKESEREVAGGGGKSRVLFQDERIKCLNKYVMRSITRGKNTSIYARNKPVFKFLENFLVPYCASYFPRR